MIGEAHEACSSIIVAKTEIEELTTVLETATHTLESEYNYKDLKPCVQQIKDKTNALRYWLASIEEALDKLSEVPDPPPTRVEDFHAVCPICGATEDSMSLVYTLKVGYPLKCLRTLGKANPIQPVADGSKPSFITEFEAEDPYTCIRCHNCDTEWTWASSLTVGEPLTDA